MVKKVKRCKQKSHKTLDRRLTTTELAERWNLKPATLYQWRWEGKVKLPPSILVGSAIRYRLCDVEKFEEERLFRNTPESKKADPS